MNVSTRVSLIQAPPIAAVTSMAQAMEAQGRRVIRLGQATVWYGPPPWALEAVRSLLDRPSLHLYAPDPGLVSTRHLVATRWLRAHGIEADPDGELLLTCGASEAFALALISVTEPGQRVVLTDPGYFDHLFAVQFLGLHPVLVPMEETEEGFSFPVEALAEEVRGGASAVVVATPSNPTGTVLGQDQLRALAHACAEASCALVLDETYLGMVYGPRPAWHPWADPLTRPWCVVVGSFSKVFGMAGWRVGYLVAPPSVVEQALKVHDALAICAPVVGQVLVEEALRGPWEEWVAARVRELRGRMELARDALLGSSSLAWRQPQGATFSLLAYRSGLPSTQVAAWIMEKTGVVLVPGSAFGPHGEGHVRLSFGSSPLADLREALHRLVSLDLSQAGVGPGPTA